MTGPDQPWRESFPVKWTPTGSLLYSRDGPIPSQREQAWKWRNSRLTVSGKRNIIESSLIGDGRTVIDPSLIMFRDADLAQSYSNSEWGWHNAKITVTDGVPFAKQKPMKFSAFCEQITERDRQQGQTAESKLELDIYELAHVLFDKYDDKFSRGLNLSQKSKFAERIRKDRLSEFWASLIQQRHSEQLRSTPSEEHAIVLLSAHQIHDACYRLTELGSPRLSTMVAQLDTADDQFHSDMAEQLRAWRDQNIISEVSEPIRALYELLAGNTTISGGKSQGPLENRASTFSISERFNLDWTQAFGLCLWYGKTKNGNIEDAVRDFAEKLATKQESATPYPDGVNEGEQQHPLWVLLQIFAAAKGSPEDAPSLPQSLAPLASPFDNRIPFQLHHALTANIPTLPVDTHLANKLVIDLTFQLSASSFHLGAVFALMHISDPQVREYHIRDLLIRHAASLPQLLDHKAAEIDKQWQILVERLKVPTAWLCKAKAIHHRSMHQNLYELRYLLLGKNWVEAHQCLVQRVAPRAVIEEDWDVIRAMVGQFGKEIKQHVSDWGTGAGMYEDFVELIASETTHNKESRDEEKKQEREVRIKRLQAALAEVGQEFKRKGSDLAAGGLDELEQRVACQEMARMVADVVAREQVRNLPRLRIGMIIDAHLSSKQKPNHVLELPLTADARLGHAREMALRHYRAVMAAN
jgi:nuclear pore complex protein Nup98-Nup96